MWKKPADQVPNCTKIKSFPKKKGNKTQAALQKELQNYQIGKAKTLEHVIDLNTEMRYPLTHRSNNYKMKNTQMQKKKVGEKAAGAKIIPCSRRSHLFKLALALVK